MIAEETKISPSFVEEGVGVEDNIDMSSTEDGFTGPPSSWFTGKQCENDESEDCAKNKHECNVASYQELILSDSACFGSYIKVCRMNKRQFAGKIVLNIGCGTGILAMKAAAAGAKHVFAVEHTDVADFARQIIKDNGFESLITVIKGKMEEVELPVDKVDIIISRWMGYFLLHESLLDAVLHARDKYLDIGGLILPDRASLYLAAINDYQYKQEKYGDWENMYGIDMDCIREAALSEVLVDSVNANQLMTTICRLADITIYQINSQYRSLKCRFSLTLLKSENIYAFVAWFGVRFNFLRFPVTLFTDPFNAPTHWKQAVMYLPEVVVAKKGGSLSGTLTISRTERYQKDLNIGLSYCYKDATSTVSGSKMYKLR